VLPQQAGRKLHTYSEIKNFYLNFALLKKITRLEIAQQWASVIWTDSLELRQHEQFFLYLFLSVDR
jgi:hypothetical protein